ncbi:MAG: RHS repeat-associated core domain-containing protein, partial [Spirochaetales bacterium]|nr:RHS repeat-associated core domain-containing protein [Spirochaetales bacterium]
MLDPTQIGFGSVGGGVWKTGNYRTSQSYAYDNLYQLIRVDGSTTYNPYMSPIAEYESSYSQVFTFDANGLGNMMSKVSTETVNPRKAIGDELNYSFENVYDENYAHRVIRSGDRYYQYDENGNIIIEQDGQIEEETVTYHRVTEEAEGVYGTDYGWGLFKEKSGESMKSAQSFRRTYTWNERNQLIASSDNAVSVAYTYGQDGQRSNKYTANSETLYFNKMWTLHVDSGNSYYGGQNAKNIYLGETRIVTKLAGAKETTAHEETYKQYFYHSDHLGSASLISDYKGDEYQRIEYTPYGETWVEKTSNTGDAFLPYKFTAKEQDEETGLYYYGARYLDPKYSRWLSTDPALGDYIPQAPISDEARKNNQNLPGMGGIFNHINCNLYAYGANNPVHYIDPDGNQSLPCISPR